MVPDESAIQEFQSTVYLCTFECISTMPCMCKVREKVKNELGLDGKVVKDSKLTITILNVSGYAPG